MSESKILTKRKTWGIIMANNRIAYGLAKKHGIDTEGMTPKQVWDALGKKGVDVSKEAQSEKSEEMGLHGDWEEDHAFEDFFDEKSVSVRMFEINKTEKINSDDIIKKVAIMGYKTGKPIRASYGLSQKYGGSIEKWQKMRGEAMMKGENKEMKRAEVHWYKNEEKDFLECKFKRWL